MKLQDSRYIESHRDTAKNWHLQSGQIGGLAALRWIGLICRMDDCRLPKRALYGKLSEGDRKVKQTVHGWYQINLVHDKHAVSAIEGVGD